MQGRVQIPISNTFNKNSILQGMHMHDVFLLSWYHYVNYNI